MKPLLLADDLKDDSSNDASRSQITRAWARFFAQKLGSTLQAATVLQTNESVWEQNMLHRSYSKIITEMKERAIEARKLKALSAKLQADPIFLAGSPVDELVKLTKSKKFEMVVVGTHGREGLKRVLLGSVAEEIVRHSDIPVCVLGPQVQKVGILPPKSKRLNIVVAVDLDEGSREAELFAAKFAKKTGATLTLVHCAYQGQDPMLQLALNTPEGPKNVEDLFHELNETSSAKLVKKQAKIEDAGVECKVFLDKTSVFPFKSILKAAEREKATLIVAGTHGRSLIGQAFFGSTARQTILRSLVPVVIVRSR